VRTLYDLGLLDLVRTRPRRGATEHFYRTRQHPAFSDEAWANLDVVPKQRMISAALQQIHDYASRSAAAGGFDRPDAHFSRAPLKLDRKGWTELAKISKKWLEQALKIEASAAKRIQSDPHSMIDVGLVILLFEALPFSADLEVPGDNGAVPDRRARRSPEAGRTGRRSTEPLARS
jgi:hypothetical protein